MDGTITQVTPPAIKDLPVLVILKTFKTNENFLLKPLKSNQ